jgi:hypothetical protein
VSSCSMAAWVRPSYPGVLSLYFLCPDYPGGDNSRQFLLNRLVFLLLKEFLGTAHWNSFFLFCFFLYKKKKTFPLSPDLFPKYLWKFVPIRRKIDVNNPFCHIFWRFFSPYDLRALSISYLKTLTPHKKCSVFDSPANIFFPSIFAFLLPDRTPFRSAFEF